MSRCHQCWVSLYSGSVRITNRGSKRITADSSGSGASRAGFVRLPFEWGEPRCLGGSFGLFSRGARRVPLGRTAFPILVGAFFGHDGGEVAVLFARIG